MKLSDLMKNVEDVKKRYRMPVRPCVAVNVESGEHLTFPTLKECAERIGSNYNQLAMTVRNPLTPKGRQRTVKGWVVVSIDNLEEE